MEEARFTRRLANGAEKARSLFLRAFKNITIEPCVILFITGISMHTAVVSQMFEKRICLEKFSPSICKNLTAWPIHADEVRAEWAIWNYYDMLARSIPGVSAIFIAPWSDVHGRRLAMYGPPLGGFLSSIILIVNVYVPTLPMWQLLLASVANASMGGFLGFVALTGSYICDVSDVGGDRSVRLAILEMCLYLGSALGNTIGQFLVQFGFAANFFGYMLTCTLTIVYIAVFVRETRETSTGEEAHPIRDKFLALASFEPLKLIWRTLVNIREYGGRRRLWMWLFASVVGGIFGEARSLMLPFLEFAPLYWNLQRYMFVESMSFYGVVVLYLTLYPLFRRQFQWSDTTFTLLGVGSFIVQNALLFFATSSGYVYAAFALSTVFGPGRYIAAGSLMSATVGESEQGSLSAIMAISEKLTPLVGNFFYALLFKWSLAHHLPSLSFGVAALLFTVPWCVLLWARVDLRRANKRSGPEKAHIS